MKLAHLFSAAIAAAGLALALPAGATTLTPGTLIKGPGDAVYYYANNGKRLVFPNEKTYATWYSDFSGVLTISASDLAAIPLGGNVTYRPGVKLVKITTDPKVYAVASDGTLRWVQTETLATALYGADWAQKVDDIADAFFVNYTVGSPIVNTSDYLPSQQTAAAVDIDTDHQIGGEPAPTPTPTPTSTPPTPFTFSASRATLQAGDILTLTAADTDPVGVTKIELFFDGILIKTCNAPSCSGDTQVPLSGTKDSYVVEGRATKVNTQVDDKSLTLPVNNDGSNLVQIKVGQATIMPNEAGSAIVDVDASIAIQRIDIYLDDTAVKGCVSGAHECQWSDYVPGAVGTVHPVYAKVTDTIGRTYTSKTLNITIGTNDTPGVTVSVAKTQIYDGETVDVTVSASDSDGIASIDVMKDGAVIKHCDGASPCTATTGPWQAGMILSFSGRATDTKNTVGTGDTQTVSVIAH